MLEYRERQLRQDIAHEQNLEAIRRLTSATQGLVDAWLVANSFQKFIKWIASFGVLAYVIKWISDLNIF